MINNILFKIELWFRDTTAPRLLVEGFGFLILVGTILLALPFSSADGNSIGILNALFTSTSAVCVTGLAVVPTSTAFSAFGKIILCILIQLGGMGVALFLVAMLLFGGDHFNFKSRALLVSAQNLFGYAGLSKLAKSILKITFYTEAIGAVLSFFVFIQDYSIPTAISYSIFHSVSAFNNAGFDIFGGSDSMLQYANNIPMNLITCALVIIGGLGFIVILDLKKWFKKRSHLLLTTKITLFMTALLLVVGTLFFWIFSDMDFIESFFQSVIARTAGFATFPVGLFPPACVIVFMILMFIGASPNSTGGGVKTNTVFCAILKAFSATAGHDMDSAFYRKIPEEVITKSFIVLLFGVSVIMVGSFLILVAQPSLGMEQVLVETTSAFATVGSSMGITSELNAFSKLVIIFCMFIGRLGPITIANLLVSKREQRVSFSEEKVLIG